MKLILLKICMPGLLSAWPAWGASPGSLSSHTWEVQEARIPTCRKGKAVAKSCTTHMAEQTPELQAWGPWVAYFWSCTGCKFLGCSHLPLHALEQHFFFLSCKKWVAVTESSSWKPSPDCHDCSVVGPWREGFFSRPLLDWAAKQESVCSGTFNAMCCRIAR